MPIFSNHAVCRNCIIAVLVITYIAVACFLVNFQPELEAFGDTTETGEADLYDTEGWGTKDYVEYAQNNGFNVTVPDLDQMNHQMTMDETLSYYEQLEQLQIDVDAHVADAAEAALQAPPIDEEALAEKTAEEEAKKLAQEEADKIADEEAWAKKAGIALATGTGIVSFWKTCNNKTVLSKGTLFFVGLSIMFLIMAFGLDHSAMKPLFITTMVGLSLYSATKLALVGFQGRINYVNKGGKIYKNGKDGTYIDDRIYAQAEKSSKLRFCTGFVNLVEHACKGPTKRRRLPVLEKLLQHQQ